ncbi:NAD-dependent epimerase/dehydratase family protein (plasmid) [Marinovum sp. KMM 9989]
MPSTVLILGSSGKIGQNAARAFAKAGWTVRTYDRKSKDMTAAACGVDVIVNGLNPPNYHNWSKTIPEITRQVIAAARASGATVIVPGNVYIFGDRPGVWSDTTPHRPNTVKGRVRVDMEKAYRASGVQTIVLRAGNFIDPDRDDDMMGLLYFRAIKKGKLTAAGRPDALQAMCYLPDWAEAAVKLAEQRATLARFEDIPFPGHSFSVLDLQEALQDHLGRSIKITGFPWRMFALLAPVWELAREMNEMRYLWNTSHQLCGEKFSRLLPDFVPTDMRRVMLASLPNDMPANMTAPRPRQFNAS